MKRHEALASLSREHHSSLMLAQLLKKDSPVYKGLPSDPVSKVAYAVNLFRSSMLEHFRKEEVMLEKVKNLYDEIRNIAGEIILEHQILTAGFLSLPGSVNPVEAMDDLGRKVDKHIRKEERVLFPMIQEYCSEEMLREIKLILQ